MKCAYVTLLTDDNPDFIYNIILATSLIKTRTKYDIILLYTLDVPQYKLNILNKFYTKLIKVEHIKTSQKIFNKNLSYFFTKFQIFNINNYDRLLYIDKYQLINNNIDYIFNFQCPAGFCYKNKFKRSHMFLIFPNKNIYEKSLKIIDDVVNLKEKYMDKKILNMLFKKINCFSTNLDFQKYLRDVEKNNLEKDKIQIIDYNFIKKPLTFFNKKNIKNNNNYNKYNLFYLPWFNIYMKLYRNFQQKNIDLYDIYSIISFDYEKYLKNQYPNLKKIKISKKLYTTLNTKLNTILNNYFTYKNIINYLKNNGIKVFIYGGTMRDLVGNVDIKDIDCLYIGDYKKINTLLKNIKYLDYKQGIFKKYFDIENDEMELNNLDVLKKSLDGPCNSLLYDIENKYIYDLTGYGIQDSLKKVWRLNPGDTYEEWSRDHNCILHRMVKMLKKGFHVPINDKIFIYNELYYETKDRTYWFYLRRFIDDEFKEIVINDINQLNIEYSGEDFIELIYKNLKKID